jgi:transposase-like protein
MVTSAWPKTLQAAVVYFSNPETAFAEMVKFRWPDGVVKCPTCGSENVYFTKSRRIWECKEKHAKRQFSVKIGSVMEDSPLGIDKWLIAMWLITNAKNGISSYELSSAIGITQKSAWFMLHRIRLAMHEETSGDKFSGHIEADETFIGGRARFMHKDRRERIIGTAKAGRMGKIAVSGLLERGADGTSRVRTRVVPNVRRFALQSEIRKQVESGSTVYSDDLKSYIPSWKWGPHHTYVHKVIDHAEKYVDGVVHTNGMENYWSLLKRMLRGTYVSVEPFHLFRYLDEQALRFNTRKLTDAARFAITAAAVFGKRLTFDVLTGKDLPQSC